MATIGPDGPPEDTVLWIAGIGGAAIILMWAFLNYRDRKKDKRHKKWDAAASAGPPGSRASCRLVAHDRDARSRCYRPLHISSITAVVMAGNVAAIWLNSRESTSA